MKYYIDFNTKKIHADECWCTRDFKNEEGWQKYKTLKDAEKVCIKSGKRFRYCGVCMKKYNKAVVK